MTSTVAPPATASGPTAPRRAPGMSVWFCGLAIAIIALVVVYLFFRIRKQDAQVQKLKQQARHTLDDKDVHDCMRHFLADPTNRETIGRAVVPAIPWQGILDQHTGRVLEALDRADCADGDNGDNVSEADNADEDEHEVAASDDENAETEAQSISQQDPVNHSSPADFTPLEAPSQ